MKQPKTYPMYMVAKASKSEKNRGLEGFEDKDKDTDYGTFDKRSGSREESTPKSTKNIHPCVKPIALMQYLITLVTKEGDTVLDPFGGSCTTAVACKRLRRKFIVIEKEEEYIKIGRARLKAEPDTLL